MLPDRIRTFPDLERLLASTTNYEERMPRDDAARAFDLTRMRDLCAALGNPQEGPTTFHVTGSKGKGSTARMVDAAIRAAGHGPVGLYVSPHLERLTERVCVDGIPVAGDELARAADALLPHLRATLGTPRFPTFFEVLTATAYVAFRTLRVRSLVLEVGLGGRLDATTVCRPAATAITSIELEHVKLLGDTLEKIAGEKAGILKSGVPCASAVPLGTGAARVIEEAARAVGAPLDRLDAEFRLLEAETGPGPATRVVVLGPAGAPALEAVLPVAGLHQARNAAVAIAACRRLSIPDAAIARGFASVSLPGRMERVLERPDVVIDTAHTAASARAAADALDACFSFRALHLVIGVLEEKDVLSILAPLVPRAARVTACEVASPRALPAARLAAAALPLAKGPVTVAASAAAGLEEALSHAGPDDLVLVTGSAYLAGAARTAARGRPGFLPRD